MDGVLGFFAGTGASVPLSDFLLRMLVAWLCGQLVGWFYTRSHGVLSYSQNFAQSLVMLTMVISVITAVIGDSLARAFGLAAALAIVRFRTPVKDARDTTFLFLSVGVGMSAGAGQLMFSALATIAVGVAALYLAWMGFGLRTRADGLLRFRLAAPDARDAVQQLIIRYTTSFELSAARTAGAGNVQELVYDVNLRQDQAGDQLVAELAAVDGVSGVSLLPHARSGEA